MYYNNFPFLHSTVTLKSVISNTGDQDSQGGRADDYGWGTDYVVLRYPTPPHTIHPPHRIVPILEESVIVLRRFRIPTNNIVS